MKVIDLLNKIANGEEVPKKIKVYNNIYEYESFNKLYWNSNDKQLFEIYNGRILNYEVEIIEDILEEDKKIQKLNIGTIVDDELQGLIKSINQCNKEIQFKINAIIDKVNGDSDDN